MPLDISQKSGYARGVDWILFLETVVPTVLIEMYEKQEHECKKGHRGQEKIQEITAALRALSKSCSISLRYSISRMDLITIKNGINTWHDFIEKYLPDFMFTANQHSLSHIMQVIEQQGPLRYFSARPLERLIGLIKSTLRSKTNIGQNAINEMNKSFTIHNFSRMTTNITDSVLYPRGVSALVEDFYQFSKPGKSGELEIDKAVPRDPMLLRAVKRYLTKTQQRTMNWQISNSTLIRPYNHLTLLRNRCKITPGKYLIVELIVDEGGGGTEEKYFVANCEFLFQVKNLSLCMIRVYKKLKNNCYTKSKEQHEISSVL